MIPKRPSPFILCAFLAALCMAPQTFASGLTFTCNSDVNTLADADNYTANGGNLCGSIQATLGNAYSSAFMDANANIYIEFTSDAGLGASATGYLNLVSYDTYYSALMANSSGNTVDTDALASLSSTEASVFSATNGNIEITSALAEALNISSTNGNTHYVTGTTAPTTNPMYNSGNPSVNDTGSACNVLYGSPNCYNGIIFLQDPASIEGGAQGYYYGRGTQTPAEYDIFSVLEHETDEILGTSSCIDGTTFQNTCGNNASAVDLFRYTAPGTLAAYPSTSPAHFSYDGGTTVVGWYNHSANGQDYADFNSADTGTQYNCTFVQDAEGCLGAAPLINNDGGAEITILDAIGYNTVVVPEPGTVVLFGSALAVLPGLRMRRRRTVND